MNPQAFYFILICLFITEALPAEPVNFAFTWFLIKDDNAFRSRNPYDELVNTYALYAGKTLGTSASSFRIYYNGDLSRYSSYEDRQHNSHQLGLAYKKMITQDLTGTMGLSGRLRRNESKYIYYNVDTYSLYGNLQFEPDLANIYTFGLTYEKNNFREFNNIDNNEYSLFARYQHFFQNKISLTGEFSLGVKNYINQYQINYYGATPFFRFNQRYTEEAVKATLLSGSFNIGRSLTMNTGINAELGIQRYLGDPIEVIAGDIYYYTENDLYDDRFGFENERAALILTRQFGIGFQAKAGVSHQNKRYEGTPAFTAGGELSGSYRNDRQTDYFFLITKSFDTGIKFPNTISAFCKINFRNNPSNDPYYHYNDQLGIIGLTIGM